MTPSSASTGHVAEMHEADWELCSQPSGQRLVGHRGRVLSSGVWGSGAIPRWGMVTRPRPGAGPPRSPWMEVYWARQVWWRADLAIVDSARLALYYAAQFFRRQALADLG